MGASLRLIGWFALGVFAFGACSDGTDDAGGVGKPGQACNANADCESGECQSPLLMNEAPTYCSVECGPSPDCEVLGDSERGQVCVSGLCLFACPKNAAPHNVDGTSVCECLPGFSFVADDRDCE